ncbi:putative phosphatase regulatory subunit-domain-containing protein [Cercophora scortea]|uniref:Phosphatase regulatory subunit-domain-containing protein n=1 Tax=Cercophora scortea TaxID=314031 RepID=A0AAE0IW65_9PEZI|nr:putative phosphatase regulatory subunit-domain-containing protein [Cercophora scortea]
MPYTPPSHHRSPASSAPTSPETSRRSSFHQGQNGNSRPVLPRSASYLTKQRRTPSASGPPNRITEPSPASTNEDLAGMVKSSTVRQSPPPVTGDRGMPNGAVISPPDSSSDDDDLPEVHIEARGRQIENLKELHEAISQIPQHRSSSPDRNKTSTTLTEAPDAGDLLVLSSQSNAISEGMHQSFSLGQLGDLANRGNRRISHARSATEPDCIILDTPIGSSLTSSEEDSDEETHRKPQMVRKKSGELVRPALRPSSRRRPSSMPGTPTFSKAVHFDSHLEHVRHFLQVDRPLAVSAGSSPVDSHDSDTEYPFTGDNRSSTSSLPYEWDIITSNFPTDTPVRKTLPVRLERVWLSNDQKCLIGSVVVANIAFQKFVTCRFTLDYWKTTSEVTAEYMSDVRLDDQSISHDRFNFTIKLSDMANLESKTLYFCIRYNVTGQEHWDNNGGINFQVDFRKKMLPQNGKKGVIGAASRPVNGLPKSQRRAAPSVVPRPKSMPVGADDFGDDSKLSFDQSLDDYLRDAMTTSLRLKGVKSTTNLPSDNLSNRLPAPSGQAFANRYDFGASLTAAIQTAKDSTPGKPDGLYMKPSNKKPFVPPTLSPQKDTTRSRESTKPSGAAPATGASKPAPKPATTVSGTDSPSASISSSSYEELVNKYCFFGTKPLSPQLKDGTLRGGRYDGADDIAKSTDSSSTSSYESSPVQLNNYYHSHSGIQHHSLHPKDPNPYFQHASPFMSIGASPSQSPLRSFSPHLMGSPLAGQMQSSSASSQTVGRSPSPAALVGSFTPYAGTSSNEYPYQQTPDRFPFSGAEAHSATAIRG